MNVFVTGTDTGVGKTIVSAWICQQTKACYWKPFQTGCEEDSRSLSELSKQISSREFEGAYEAQNRSVLDIYEGHWGESQIFPKLHEDSSIEATYKLPEEIDKKIVQLLSPETTIIDEVYCLKAPLSPYNAANLENIKINIDKVLENISNIKSNTVIEGTGGILVPICENFQMIDLAQQTNSKVLIVAKSQLGFLNHIFLTVEILKRKNIQIIGIVLVGKVENFLIKTIEKFSKVKVLSILPIMPDLFKLISNTPLPREIYEVLQ
ncbi:MAG: dethiobiotin synthase [Holosporales bacterium]|jgi:dethiobiotin synthase|nr:dethiobiotin synthase [Holosporales bacterium]